MDEITTYYYTDGTPITNDIVVIKIRDAYKINSLAKKYNFTLLERFPYNSWQAKEFPAWNLRPRDSIQEDRSTHPELNLELWDDATNWLSGDDKLANQAAGRLSLKNMRAAHKIYGVKDFWLDFRDAPPGQDPRVWYAICHNAQALNVTQVMEYCDAFQPYKLPMPSEKSLSSWIGGVLGRGSLSVVARFGEDWVSVGNWFSRKCGYEPAAIEENSYHLPTVSNSATSEVAGIVGQSALYSVPDLIKVTCDHFKVKGKKVDLPIGIARVIMRIAGTASLVPIVASKITQSGLDYAGVRKSVSRAAEITTYQLINGILLRSTPAGVAISWDSRKSHDGGLHSLKSFI
jgi:hypothetical protein